MNNELIYWIALTQLKNWRIERLNLLIVSILIDNKTTLEEFFSENEIELKNKYNLNDKEIQDINNAKNELPNYSFLLEDLLSQGYEIITIDSPKYSKTLKDNLKLKNSPPILYIKGNTQLLQENSIAVVGSREADDISLRFADNVVKKASKEFKVIVSGFAKGVDKQALDSAIKYIGQSIIVLPQGIMTFSSGFNKYYKEINRGDVLVLSTFYPKAPWSVQLAMARNPIIYGLAKEIYVAQSSEQGGTWAGVIDGLRKGRTIYVRTPEVNESNANNLIIEKGGIAVDLFGNTSEGEQIRQVDIFQESNKASVVEINQDSGLFNQSEIIQEPVIIEETKNDREEKQVDEEESLESKIIRLLENSSPLTAKDIILQLKLNQHYRTLTSILNKIPSIVLIPGKPNKFTVKKSNIQTGLW